MAQEEKEPVDRITFAHVEAVIQSVNSGTRGKFYTVSFFRNYEQGGENRQTSRFRRDDLPLLRKVLDQAWERLWNRYSNGDQGSHE